MPLGTQAPPDFPLCHSLNCDFCLHAHKKASSPSHLLHVLTKRRSGWRRVKGKCEPAKGKRASQGSFLSRNFLTHCSMLSTSPWLELSHMTTRYLQRWRGIWCFTEHSRKEGRMDIGHIINYICHTMSFKINAVSF